MALGAAGNSVDRTPGRLFVREGERGGGELGHKRKNEDNCCRIIHIGSVWLSLCLGSPCNVMERRRLCTQCTKFVLLDYPSPSLTLIWV